MKKFPILNQPPYKITPYFSKKNVQTVDLYRETNIHPSILFSPPHFKGTFAVFSQGYFIMTLWPPLPFPPANKNLEKYPPPAYPTPTTIKHRRVKLWKDKLSRRRFQKISQTLDKCQLKKKVLSSRDKLAYNLFLQEHCKRIT